MLGVYYENYSASLAPASIIGTRSLPNFTEDHVLKQDYLMSVPQSLQRYTGVCQ